MVNRRRLTRVATSDDEEDEAPRPQPQRTRKRMRLLDEDLDNDNQEEEEDLVPKPEPEPEPAQVTDDAKPIGEPIRLSGKGRGRKKHYNSFEYDGIQYSLVIPFFSSIFF